MDKVRYDDILEDGIYVGEKFVIPYGGTWLVPSNPWNPGEFCLAEVLDLEYCAGEELKNPVVVDSGWVDLSQHYDHSAARCCGGPDPEDVFQIVEDAIARNRAFAALTEDEKDILISAAIATFNCHSERHTPHPGSFKRSDLDGISRAVQEGLGLI